MKIQATSRTAPRRATLAFLAPALALMLALIASPGGAPAAAASDHQGAEQQARKAFTAGDYEKALAIYVDLYDETHHPTYLRNIARCHQNLGHAEKAIAGFREYLRKVKNLPPEQQAEIQKYIAEMEELKRKETAAPGGAAEGSHDQKRVEAGRARPIADGREPQPAGVDLSLHAVPAEKDNQANASSPFYTRVWFWAVVGALAAGVATTIVVVSADRGPAYGNLGHVDVPASK
jgi:tetratricopeptide (TPR) repeat protein